MTYTVHIEGNIASGKSTLLRGLEKIQEATCFFEPVDEWSYVSYREHSPNLLQDFYTDPKKHAREFQEMVLETYAGIHSTEVSTTFKILERSIHSSSIFRSVLVSDNILSPDQDEELQQIYQATCASVPTSADLVLYLRSDPMLCLQFLHERGRAEESDVGLPYLTRLHYAPERWVKCCPYPVIILDTAPGIDEVRKSAIVAIFRSLAEAKIHKYLTPSPNATT